MSPRPRQPSPRCWPLTQLQLTLVIGRYAAAHHLAGERAGLTAAVSHWRRHGPALMPLPHPSPTNNRWLARHRWFEQELVPHLQARVGELLRDADRAAVESRRPRAS